MDIHYLDHTLQTYKQVLVDNGVHIDEIKLYGDTEDVDENDMLADEDGFSELESVISKVGKFDELTPLSEIAVKFFLFSFLNMF